MVIGIVATVIYNIVFWLIYMMCPFESIFFLFAIPYALFPPVLFYVIYNKIIDSDSLQDYQYKIYHVVQGFVTAILNAGGFLIFYAYFYKSPSGFHLFPEGGEVTSMVVMLTTAEFVVITICNYVFRNKEKRNAMLFLAPFITLSALGSVGSAILRFESLSWR